VKDMSSKPKDKSSKSRKDKSEDDEPKHHIVLVGKRKNVEVDDVTNEEEYNKAEDMMTLFAVDVEQVSFYPRKMLPTYTMIIMKG
jgi:hypothetical protein